MKGIMIHVGPRIFGYQLAEFPGSRLLRLPHQRRCFRDQNQKQSRLHLGRRELLLGDFMLAYLWRTVHHGDLVGFGPCTETPAEAPGHAHQMGVIQVFIRTVEFTPPHAKATSCLAHTEIRIQNHAIDAIVIAFEKIAVKGAQLVGHVWQRIRNWAFPHRIAPRVVFFAVLASLREILYWLE